MNFKMQGLENVRLRLEKACKDAGREPGTVRLLAVGKKHPAEALRLIYSQGQRDFGENEAQEAVRKQSDLLDLDITWHFIGNIQSNKTRLISRHFDWVQSVDREKILRRLSSQRSGDAAPLNICLQVNIDAEPQKAGMAPAELHDMARLARELPQLRLRGLMCIPRAGVNEVATRDSFRRTRSLYDALRKQGYPLDTLSMGMSGDLELAILEGSNMVRVGTDIFGPRAQESHN
ncbi:MAG: YggS family pyridoxal phosphate-dependent enzyme [Xanthomonadales bacterium]|nr:YggS family pyridoxal phosphate-dependent enzyme [Gammaproteobacteria bacterium]NNL95513.1 YggS family pyridoxal phosphate-dependent enzyme [Xanthomonadales bacterium]